MFKKELGISVYPEKSDWESVEKYLIKAHKCGFTKIFMSWFHLRWTDQVETKTELYIKTIKKAKELGFYIILDINDNKFDFYKSLGVNCVRMDAPSWPGEVANYTQETDFDFQINMSGDSNYLESILMCDVIVENISGCHNFYPLINTGLIWNDFLKWNKYFNDHGIHTSAFINSQYGQDAPQPFKLTHGVVTVEDLRFLPIRTQAKLMWATKQIDAVYIGNQFASDEELESLKNLDTKKIELDIELLKDLDKLEKDVLALNHNRRGDINENFIRSTVSRIPSKSIDIIKEVETNHQFKKGDIVIINHSDKHYQGELEVVLRNVKIPNAHLLGKVKDYDFKLLDFITAGRWFKFRIIT